MTGPLRVELTDYLALRRALGYRMARPEKLLAQYLDHLDSQDQSRITVANALHWARLPADNGPSNWWAYRLSAVRGFATYLHASTLSMRCLQRTCCRSDRCGPTRTCIPATTSRA